MKKSLLYTIFLLFSFSLYSQSGDMPLYTTAPSGGGTLEGCKGLILATGFTFKSEAGKSLTLRPNTAKCVDAVTTTSISSNQNYIVTITPLDETKSIKYDNGKITIDRTTCGDVRTQTAIAYFDGLGRPVQTIQTAITPTKKDLIAYQEYDNFGRESNTWLPVAIQSNNGAYASLDKIKNNTNAIYPGEANPYSVPVYEASPLNRIQEQYGPGQEWHKTRTQTNADNRKAVKTEYYTNQNKVQNGKLGCNLYTINGSGVNSTLSHNGHYPDNTLYVTLIKDEDNNSTYEFKDKLGQVVLMRQINIKDGKEEHMNTYYVYDDFGNQCYVLPPLTVDNQAKGLGDDSDPMKQYTYIYKYDNRNRCIKKRLPGTDWILYVYDKADRPIFTQDGEQRTNNKNEWTFAIPDAFGRIALSGICTNPITTANIETYLKDIIVKADWANKETTDKGYTISGISLTTPTYLSVNYYDNYEFINKNKFPNYTYDKNKENEGYGKQYAGTKGYEHKGLLTGTITAIFGKANEYLYTAMYYDTKKQLIQSRSNNHMGGTDVASMAYTFTGQPTKIQTEQTVVVSGKTQTTKELYTYTYDHAGRQIETKHQLNAGTTIILAKNEYDELGRVKTNKKGDNSLNTTYTYTIRSWTKTIETKDKTNKLLMNQTLAYNDVLANNPYTDHKPSYSGNISAMSWQLDNDATRRTYRFHYDNLSRLTHAAYNGKQSGGDHNTSYTYDKQGNIMNLVRLGLNDNKKYSIVDNLTMTYHGNQLFNTHDTGDKVNTSESSDFKDHSIDATKAKEEYTYNSNGAMRKDLNKGINNIQYNSLNLPTTIEIANTNHQGNIQYTYSASGAKLRTVHTTNRNIQQTALMSTVPYNSTTPTIKTTDYIGNKIYENNQLKRILIDGGYYDNTEKKYYFYAQDHLGNNRIVSDQTGTVHQRTHYYPFGMAFAEGTNPGAQPYKYNGKELDKELGLEMYDYLARYTANDIPRFMSVDPHAENYYSWSPYVYVGNNPLKYIDPTGMDWVFRYAEGKYEVYYDRDVSSQKDVFRKYGRYTEAIRLDNGTNIKFYNGKGEITGDFSFKNDLKENKYGTVTNGDGETLSNSEITEGDRYRIFGTSDESVDASTLYKNLFGSSYIGGNNPKTYKDENNERKDSYQFKPIGKAEAAAYQHDLDYDRLGATGPADAFLNRKTGSADRDLANRSRAVMNNPNLPKWDRKRGIAIYKLFNVIAKTKGK